MIKLKAPNSPDYEVRVLVDTQRHVVLRVSQFYRGKLTSATAFSDFVQVGGHMVGHARGDHRREGADDFGGQSERQGARCE